jgi:hypothetical protein
MSDDANHTASRADNDSIAKRSYELSNLNGPATESQQGSLYPGEHAPSTRLLSRRDSQTALDDPTTLARTLRLPEGSYKRVQDHSKRQEPRKRITKRVLKFWDSGWVQEVASCLFAMLALAAIIITLAIHSGRPIPEWPRLISINSLIAIFSALFRAGIVFPISEGEN